MFHDRRPVTGRRLIDYLLSAEVELHLLHGRSAQIPLATDLARVKTPWDKLADRSKTVSVDVRKAAADVANVVNLPVKARMDR